MFENSSHLHAARVKESCGTPNEYLTTSNHVPMDEIESDLLVHTVVLFNSQSVLWHYYKFDRNELTTFRLKDNLDILCYSQPYCITS